MKPGHRHLTLELPGDLIDELGAAAEARVIGRNLLGEHLIRDGLRHLIPVDQFIRRAATKQDTARIRLAAQDARLTDAAFDDFTEYRNMGGTADLDTWWTRYQDNYR